MSGKPYRPEVDDRVRVRGSDKEWIVLTKPKAAAPYVVGPADGGTGRRLVTASECEPWTDAHTPAEEAPRFSPAEIEAALGKPRAAPTWVEPVLDELVGDWLTEWERQPAVLHGVELAASLAALVASRWVLLDADAERIAELAACARSDPRPQAIATLAGVVLPLGLQRLQEQQEQQPT